MVVRKAKRQLAQELINTRYEDLPYWASLGLKFVAEGYKKTFQSIVPLASIMLVYFLLTPESFGLLGTNLFAWSVGEVIFFLVCKKMFQTPFQRKPSPLGEKEMLAMCRRVKANVGDMQHMLSQWLLEKPEGEIYQEYFSEWVAWLMFDRKEESLNSEEQVQLQRVLTEFCQGLRKSPKPLLHKPRCMRPSLDIFPKQPKPLVAYLGIKSLNALSYMTLRHFGFHHNSEDGLSYWHCSGNSSEPPIIFIHGLGIGLFPYLEKVRRLKQHAEGRRIFLLELPHISMEIYHNILNHDQTLVAIDSLFKRHSLDKVTLVAHSYGTLVASWLIQHRQHLLHKVTLVDPICFNMWESTLVTNFLYAKPFSFSHEMAQFFVAQDPLISHTLAKEIYWYESVLFPQDIHVPANIFLSSQDWVVDAAACADYLRPSLPPSSKIHLMETSHGGYLTSPSEYDRVFNTL